MADGKAGGPMEKHSFTYHICCKVRVVGHPKMINFEEFACFAVASVLICLLDTKKLSSPKIWMTAK